MLTKKDYWLIFGLFIGTLLSRIPFRSIYLYHWDSVNFALGMEHFDLRLHQPQPPGYFFYVMLGRLVDYFTQDANAALVWLSVFFSALLVVIIFLLGRAMFNQPVALITALLCLSSPSIWFHSEIALTRVIDAFFSVAFAWVCYELFQGKKQFFWLSAVLLGIIGGFRQQTLLLLFPLWLFVLFRRQTWNRIVWAGAIIVGITLLWLIPTVFLSGGWEQYTAANQAAFAAENSLGGKSPLNDFFSLAAHLVRLSAFTTYGLWLGLIPLVYGLIWRMRPFSSLIRDRRAWFIAIWAGPNFLLNVYWVQQPGHIFNWLPALLLLAGLTTYELGRHLGRILTRNRTFQEKDSGRDVACNVSTTRWINVPGSVLAGLIIIANILFFLLTPPFLFNIQRTAFSATSWPNIRQRDYNLATQITFIKQYFNPQTTAILASEFDFRHADYYLRSFQRTSLSYELATESIELDPQIKYLVLFDVDLVGRNHNPERLKTMTKPDGSLLYYLETQPGERFLVNSTQIEVR